MKKIICLIAVFVGMLLAGYAQDFKGFNWIDLEQDTSIKLQGQLWGGQVKNRFDRLPASHENIVRKEVWNLARNPAGICLDFHTMADTVVLSYKYEAKDLKHISPTGISGVDLYAQTKNKEWVWVKGKYTSFKKEEASILFEELKGDEVIKYRLYFPLYNTISDFRIGLNKQSQLKQLSDTQKPIIVYGTSIAQGASASRAGMAWTALLGRQVNAPVVNLGFSANGRLEKELVDLIASKKASIYIIDCLPNLVAFTDGEVYQRLLYAWRTLRSQHPKTPIIFTEHADATINLLNNNSQNEYQRVNRNLRKFITENIAGKDKNVYVVSAESINLGIDDTVDGIHPSDMGMKKYADAYLKIIRNL